MRLDYLNPLLLFPIVGLLALAYYLLPRRLRWTLLLAASYAFYYWAGSWMIGVLVFSTAANYLLGLGLGSPRVKAKRTLLWMGVLLNVVILFFFKYISSILAPDTALMAFLSTSTGGILAPAGLSFYTLQNISYLLDVSKGLIPAERNPGIFALYLAFFPKVLAGPIERGKKLIPQLRESAPLEWENIVAGARLILFGLFKKVVIADRLARFVNEVFAKPGEYQGLTVWVGLVFLGFQIYLDFAGYTDIALGVASIFGIKLTPNFKRPYLSDNIMEFWNRWHLSFSTWLRDYIFFPLRRYFVKTTGKSAGTLALLVPPVVTMLVSGIWHGTGWTFLLWGLYHALFYTLAVWWKNRGTGNAKARPLLLRIFFILVNFGVLTISWLIFRASNMQDAFLIFKNIIAPGQMRYDLGEVLLHTYAIDFYISRFAILLVIAVEIFLEVRQERFKFEKSPFWLRWGVYLVMILSLTLLGIFQEGGNPFVYFRF